LVLPTDLPGTLNKIATILVGTSTITETDTTSATVVASGISDVDLNNIGVRAEALFGLFNGVFNNSVAFDKNTTALNINFYIQNCINYRVLACPDLSVTASYDKQTYNIGDPYKITVVAANYSDGIFNNVMLSNPATNVGTLTQNTTRTYTVEGIVTAETPTQFTTTIVGDSQNFLNDLFAGNNTVTTSAITILPAIVLAPNVSVTDQTVSRSVLLGEYVTFNIFVNNDSEVTTEALKLKVDLAPGFIYNSNNLGNKYNPATGIVNVPPLLKGQRFGIRINAKSAVKGNPVSIATVTKTDGSNYVDGNILDNKAIEAVNVR
jgi:Domain of unknown function DUF11